MEGMKIAWCDRNNSEPDIRETDSGQDSAIN